ncbi:MAG: chromosome segregation protein SMC, partial [Myxococcota bacterium]
MGEQSAKHLRGSGMQDVIFAGCEARGPMSLCEVTITFHNDGNLVPPEYQGCEEISVTRRLFRDGTSEYAINKIGCRLRDILDLFMGTGIGKNAYSIIEQGRIGLIVTAKPDDRRAFIEDAAGVSRYKSRRKQAERRISATEQNLLRITDMTEELGQRLTNLTKQAEKAEKYKKLKEELRTLELSASVHRYLELRALKTYEVQACSDLQKKVTKGESKFESVEKKQAERQEELTKRDETLRARENELHDHRQALALAKNDSEYLGRQAKSLEERSQEARSEQETLQKERATLVTEEAQASDEGRFIEEADGELRALDERTEALDEGRRNIDALQSQLEGAKQKLVETISVIAERKNTLANAERSDGDTEAQIKKATEARKAAAQRARDAETKLKELKAELEKNRQLKLKLDDRRGEQEGLGESLRKELADLEGSMQANQQALMDKRSRLNSLQDIQKNYEGCTEAVRLLMQRKSHEASSGLHGLVADVLTPEPTLEAAVEGLLGERLQHVIVNSQNDAVAAV